MGSLGNPRLASQRDPPDHTLQKVKSGWTDLIAACPVVDQSFEMGYGNVTAASGGVAGHNCTQPLLRAMTLSL